MADLRLGDFPECIEMERLLDVDIAAPFSGYESTESFRKAARRGEAPRPRKVGLRKVAWRLGDLVEFNKSRPAA